MKSRSIEADSSALRPEAVPTAASSPPTRSLGRIPSLDGLRGVAVIIVVVSHMNVLLPMPRLLVIPGGTVSLDSFFVLSGFLITTIMLREQARTGTVHRLGFYRRRALRLLPLLFVFLVAHVIFAILTGIPYHVEWTSVLSVGFYYTNWKLALHSNYFGGHIATGMQHLWSLSVEEQFYLVWPWVTIFLLGIRTRLRTVVIVLVSVIALVALHRAIVYQGPNDWYRDFVRTDTRADSILIGCLLAHIWIRGRIPRRGVNVAAWISAVFLVVCLPTVDLSHPFLYHGGLLAIDVASAMIVLALVEGKWGGRHVFNLRPFVMLGTVSYGLYVWHLLVFFAVRYYGRGWTDATRVTVAVAVSLALTATSWRLLERPSLKWKSRLEGRRRPSDDTARPG